MEFDLRLAMLIGAGGFIGAILRYLVSSNLNSHNFPHGTLAVNILGAFLLGVIMFAALAGLDVSDEFRYFAGIGILGAFTTMSAFSHEVWELVETDSFRATLYVGVTLGASLLAVWLGKLFDSQVLIKLV